MEVREGKRERGREIKSFYYLIDDFRGIHLNCVSNDYFVSKNAKERVVVLLR